MTTAERPKQLFSLRLVAALIAAGIAAFAAFMLLAAYAGDFRSGRDGRAHALSVAAVGFKGLVNLVGYSGGTAHLVRSEEELGTEDLLVLAVDERADRKALAALMQARAAKPTLLILPKWNTVPDDMRSGWVYAGGLYPPTYVAATVAAVRTVRIDQAERSGGTAAGTNWLEGIRLPVPKHAQTLSGDGVAPLIVAPGGKALLAQIGEGPHYVLADPDLMNNHGVKDPRTARAALLILAALNSTGAETVSFDLTINGFGRKPNALRLLFEPPFLALTLALIVAALLAGLHGALRFGPERREERAIAFGKSALVENSASLFSLVRREHRAGGAYADLVAEEAARASGAPANLRGSELEAYLDRLSAPDAPRYSELAARARAASDRDELVSAARALFSWRKELVQ
jgi:hypothetical protein